MPRLHPLRAAWIVVAAWTVLAVTVSTMTVVSLVTFRVGLDRWFPPAARAVTRIVLGIVGVRVEIRSGAEHLAGRRARIVTINHSSQVDLFVIGSIMPAAVTVVVKKEFIWVPFLGLGFFAFDFVMINRKNREAAERSLLRAANRVKKRGATVIIAPEGTRSRDGELGPFKMGAFHLALHTGAPIVPIVVRGAAKRQPMGAWIPTPGLVTLDILPPIPTTEGWAAETLKERRDELRELYAAELAPANAL